MLVSLAFGLGAVLTLATVSELTGSLSLAVLASVLEVAIVPRTYGYPKILIYAAAFLTFVRYIHRPDTRRLVWMGVVLAIAFLFRHDHGLFLGIGAALTVLLTPDGTPWTAKLRRATLLAVGGWLAFLLGSLRSPPRLAIALLPAVGLLGYLFFTVSYPTAVGDVLKATYMLTTTVGWALGFGYALERVRGRLWPPLLVILALCALADLPFLLYG